MIEIDCMKKFKIVKENVIKCKKKITFTFAFQPKSKRLDKKTLADTL